MSESISNCFNVPNFGSLKNKSNQEFRCQHAKSLEKQYSSPSCLMHFEQQIDGTWGIKCIGNGEYFQCSIGTMKEKIEGDCQKWNLLWLKGNEFYVQNVENNEFMTSHASKLSDTAGYDEIWIIEEVK